MPGEAPDQRGSRSAAAIHRGSSAAIHVIRSGNRNEVETFKKKKLDASAHWLRGQEQSASVRLEAASRDEAVGKIKEAFRTSRMKAPAERTSPAQSVPMTAIAMGPPSTSAMAPAIKLPSGISPRSSM